MKPVIWLFILLLTGMGTASAQPLDTLESLSQINYEQFLKEEGLSDAEITQIVQLIKQTHTVKKEAQLELNINKAQLEKLLYNVDVEMEEIEKLLVNSHNYRIKAELAQIEIYVKVRKLLGRERWITLIQALKDYRKEKTGLNPKGRKMTDKQPKRGDSFEP